MTLCYKRRWVVEVECHTARVNELMKAHWRVAHALRRRDDQIIGLACKRAGVPEAKGKRRVGLHVVLGPRQREGDADEPFLKSLLDALQACRVLVSDAPAWCEMDGRTTYSRGDAPAMVVTITEEGRT